MRAELEALVYELKQMRREGTQALPVAEDTLEGLRAAVRRLAADSPAPVPVETSGAEEAAAAPGTARSVPAAPTPAKPATAPIPPPPKVVLPEGSREERWAWLRDQVLGDLVCQEHVKPGKQVVFGVGSIEAEILFCGEAPGAEEETQGEPFVGPAGELLTRIIGAMGLRREQVYICNIMNWRPEMPTAFGNRPPTQEEMGYCLPYLRAQLEVVQPKVIVALGKTAVDGLLGPDPQRRMGRIRGTWSEFNGVPLMPTFHPSYLLRNNSKRTKREVWEDLLEVMERIGMPVSERQQQYFL
ncbi:MAG: uracil-DNA glycosylase [Opitutales bacterium]